MDPELFREIGGGTLARDTPRRPRLGAPTASRSAQLRQQRKAKRNAAKRARY